MHARDRWLLAALTLAAAALRFATIDVQSYWFDEALTAKLLEMPLGDMLSDLPSTQLTPPLYYVLAWPWAQTIGAEEVALRSLSALFGIATVPLAYLVGRELLSGVAGLFAAALVAFNPLLVWYSQEARPYALLVLLAGVTLLFTLRAARLRRRRELWLWALVAALALLTHYFAAFLVVPEGLWLAWLWRPRRPALMAGGVVAAVGAALIPLAAYERSRIGTGYITDLSLSRRAIGVPQDILTGFVVKWEEPVERLFDVVAIVAIGAAAWLLWRRAGERERRAALVAAVAFAAAAVVPMAFAVVGVDFLNTRNVIAAAVPALVALAVAYAVRPRLGALGAALLCALGVAAVAYVAADEEYHRSDFRGAARALGPASGARAVVVPAVAAEIAFAQYQDGLSRMPAAGAPVGEVAVVTPYNPRVAAPRPAQPPRVPGFELVERRYAETYTLLRYRPVRPGGTAAVSPSALARVATPLLGPATVLLQRGS